MGGAKNFFKMEEEMMDTIGGKIEWFGGKGKNYIRFVYWNGSFIFVENSSLHPLNQGSQYSHAFFEGQRFYRMDDGKWVSFRYPEHFARLITSYWAIKGYDSLKEIAQIINAENVAIRVENPSVYELYEQAGVSYKRGTTPIFVKIYADKKETAEKIGHGLRKTIPDVLVEDRFVRIPLVMYADGRSYTIQDLMGLTKELFAINHFDMLDTESFYYRPFATISNSPLKLQTFEKEVVFGLFPLPWGPYLGKGDVHMIIGPWRRISPEQFKTYAKMAGNYTNSLFSANFSRVFGFVEGIMLTLDGSVAEGSAMNLFIVKDGVVYTPPLSAGILPGITRDSVIKLLRFLGKEVVERNISLEEVLSADSVFLTGTAAEVMPVTSISVPKSFERIKEYDEVFSPSGKTMNLGQIEFIKVEYKDREIADEAKNAFFGLFKRGSKTNEEFGDAWLQKMPHDDKEKIRMMERAIEKAGDERVKKEIQNRISLLKRTKAKVF